MTKSYPSRTVRNILRYQFGMQVCSKGNGTGHEVWADSKGRTCRPMLRKKDVALSCLFVLDRELAGKGIAARGEFLRALRSA
jgi:hypothetical protein